VLKAIYRYPLKSARGEALARVRVDESGLRGDREWACLDAEGAVASAKHPRRWGRLLQVRAWGEGESVRLALPGQPGPLDIRSADEALSAWLGRPVTATRLVPASPVMYRLWPEEPGLVPSWAPEAVMGAEQASAVPGATPGGRFFDFGPLHLLTTGALSTLADRMGRAVAVERFRPNLLLDLPQDPEPGARLSLGSELVVEIVYPTPRCLVPSQDPEGGSPDLALLRTLAQRYRVELPGLGQAACFGVYGRVLVPGELAVGDRVLSLSGASP
jgi:uncharacterized protein YcbX